ncbi:MAG: MltA domain-containing protein [Planctomycetes bacterium]|nr:MltA domain-containing protein [Planctomycetota bacterium]
MKKMGLFIALTSLSTIFGCATNHVARTPVKSQPNYTKMLAPGDSALRLIVDPQRMPDLTRAYRHSDAIMLNAIDNSLAWFASPSSKRFYPFEEISHEQARASLLALLELFSSSYNEQVFTDDLLRMFDVYESVGYDRRGTVLFTGYYSPTFRASRTKTSRFRYPLYKRPADLVSDPLTGEPQGRKLANGSLTTYYTRKQIEDSQMFVGNELIWLKDPLSVYIIHINGSAKLRLPDSAIVYVGYAGKTDRPYTGLGESVINEGLLKPDQLSLAAIRRMYEKDPQLIENLIMRNQNYVFFTEYNGEDWPAGSLGVPVTANRTIATDKKVYPRGGMVLIDTKAITFTHKQEELLEFMLDQDTGGAIQAPGRADIFMGVGASAEILAGGQYAEGKLYYFFLKPQYVEQYSETGLVKVGR